MGNWVVIALAIAAAGIPSGASLGAEATPGTHTVSMVGTRFQPAELTLKAGDTVVWVNDDIVPHTVNARDKSFDSGTLLPGKSWRYRFSQKGTFPYFCAIHPTMQGNLRVE